MITSKSLKKEIYLGYLSQKDEIKALRLEIELLQNAQKSEILTRKALGTNKIAAVIACRVESDRLFGKPLQNISDIPILRLLLNQLESSNLIDDIILAISEKEGNEIFVDFARKNPAEYGIYGAINMLKAVTGEQPAQEGNNNNPLDSIRQNQAVPQQAGVLSGEQPIRTDEKDDMWSAITKAGNRNNVL